MAETVFHFITLEMVSQSSPKFKTMGLAEKERRGLEVCAADFGSKRSGAATGKNENLTLSNTNDEAVHDSIYGTSQKFGHARLSTKESDSVT